MQEAAQGSSADTVLYADQENALPPEILSEVFAGMPLKELVAFRTVK